MKILKNLATIRQVSSGPAKETEMKERMQKTNKRPIPNNVLYTII